MDSHRATELEPGIVELELTRPHRRNALSSNAIAKLHCEIDRIGGDPAMGQVWLSDAHCVEATIRLDHISATTTTISVITHPGRRPKTRRYAIA